MLLLKRQQEPLGVKPSGEAFQIAIGAYHPVARYQNPYRIAVNGVADGADSRRAPYSTCYLGIADRSAVWNLLQLAPYRFLKLCS